MLLDSGFTEVMIGAPIDTLAGLAAKLTPARSRFTDSPLRPASCR